MFHDINLNDMYAERERKSAAGGLVAKRSECGARQMMRIMDKRTVNPFMAKNNDYSQSPVQLKIIYDAGAYMVNENRLSGFTPDTKRAFPTGADKDICHKLSFNDLQLHIVNALNSKNFTELESVAGILKCLSFVSDLKSQYDHDPKDTDSITSKANSLLAAMNNSAENLRIGDAHTNRGIGKRFDPNFEIRGRYVHLSPVSKALMPYAANPARIKDDKIYSSSSGQVYTRSLSPVSRSLFGF